MVAWLSGICVGLDQRNTLRRGRLVLGWVTICTQVNHLDTYLSRLIVLPSMGLHDEFQLSG